ncbi:hypothetical protein PP707_08245 [Acetobacter pasteurianus]|nr:hypothetical protein [Acetobacter pasteurianus]
MTEGIHTLSISPSPSPARHTPSLSISLSINSINICPFNPPPPILCLSYYLVETFVSSVIPYLQHHNRSNDDYTLTFFIFNVVDSTVT